MRHLAPLFAIIIWIAITVAILLSCGQMRGKEFDPKLNDRRDLFSNKTWSELPISWQFQCSFPEMFREDVRRGFEYWDDMVDVDLFKEIDDCLDDDFLFLADVIEGVIIITWSPRNDPSDEQNCTETVCYNRTIAAAHRDFCSPSEICGGSIIFWKIWFDRLHLNRISVVRHEVGHMLGMNHISIEKCLMYPYIGYLVGEKDACEVEVTGFKTRYNRKKEE